MSDQPPSAIDPRSLAIQGSKNLKDGHHEKDDERLCLFFKYPLDKLSKSVLGTQFP